MVHAKQDTAGFKGLYHKFYTKPHISFVFILFILSCCGTIYSFRDVHGDSLFGAIAVFSPGILAIWQELFVLREKTVSLIALIKWGLFSAVVGTIPLILANTIFAFGAWLLPVNRRWIGSLDDFHYWWSDAIGIQLIRIFGVGFSMQFLGSLFIFLIVVLPVYTIRHPEIMLIGSRLSNKMSERTQRSLVKSVTVSISLFTLGALLSGMTKGLFLGSRREMFSFSGLQKAAQSILPQAKEIIINMQYGIFEMESTIWLLGIILLVIGALLFLWVMINIVFEARNDKGNS